MELSSYLSSWKHSKSFPKEFVSILADVASGNSKQDISKDVCFRQIYIDNIWESSQQEIGDSFLYFFIVHRISSSMCNATFGLSYLQIWWCKGCCQSNVNWLHNLFLQIIWLFQPWMMLIILLFLVRNIIQIFGIILQSIMYQTKYGFSYW